jgi:hypothetical protein
MSEFGVTMRACVDTSPVIVTEVPELLEAGEQELALIVVLDETVNVTSATQFVTENTPLDALRPVPASEHPSAEVVA